MAHRHRYELTLTDPQAINRPKTLNAGFRPTHPLDYEPESGRVVLRCHSARALHAIPHLRLMTWHPAKS